MLWPFVQFFLSMDTWHWQRINQKLLEEADSFGVVSVLVFPPNPSVFSHFLYL
jgi:hypothetical protein